MNFRGYLTLHFRHHDNQFSLEEKRRVPGQNVFIDWFLYAINVNIILLLKTKEYIYTVIKQFTNIINKFLIIYDKNHYIGELLSLGGTASGGEIGAAGAVYLRDIGANPTAPKLLIYNPNSEPTSLCSYSLLLLAIKQKSNKFQFYSIWSDSARAQTHDLHVLKVSMLTITLQM
jgi:hypothetical protein